jgi:hypothetical protein
MLFVFFLGFLFGVFVAQESEHFPNVKDNAFLAYGYVKEMVQGGEVR